MDIKPVKVIGAGLAGCEAAWQLAKRGVPVELIEMKPTKHTPAHSSSLFAELVCSNSLRSDNIENAVGLLKEELRRLDSLIMACADNTRVPAGGALAVESIEDVTGCTLHFHDAAAPVVTKESLDMTKVFSSSRYDRGSDYLNCPMNAEEYFRFVRELVNAETVPLHKFETPKVFEGCMPVEAMAKRGEKTLAFGPLKPVGLIDPRTGKQPFAVVQLGQDNKAGTLYNIVGFQTNLRFPEQKRVFGLIPGLENAEFVRYGVMHRNSYMDSPGKLTPCFELRTRPGLFFAGQLTGVEGYVESASSGFVAGLNMANRVRSMPIVDFGAETAIGALGHYVSEYNGSDFQPMNVTFGIMEPLKESIRNKRARYAEISKRALAHIEELKQTGGI